MPPRYDPNYTTFRTDGPKPDAYERWMWKIEKSIGKYVDATGQYNSDAYIIAFYAWEKNVGDLKSCAHFDQFESVVKVDDLITIILGRSSRVKELTDVLISDGLQPLALLKYNAYEHKICTPSVLLSYLEITLEEAKRENMACKSVSVDLQFLKQIKKELSHGR